MDPIGLIKIEKQIAENGLEIVGIYHSHPDHPPRPSKTDLEYAWPIYSYIIVAIAHGNQIEPRNWCLNDTGTEFLEEPYEIIE
jgi:proteasome lid subunit RPN8/RPN11